jgi:hypothetical protein
MTTEWKLAGTKLANIAFNLAQRPGEPLTSDDCALLDKCRKEWDATIEAAPQPVRQEMTDEQIEDLAKAYGGIDTGRHYEFGHADLFSFARALLAQRDSQPAQQEPVGPPEQAEHKSVALKSLAALAHLSNGVDDDGLSNDIKHEIGVIVKEVDALSQCAAPAAPAQEGERV